MNAIHALAQWRVRRHFTGRFFDREAFTGENGFADEAIGRVEHTRIGGHQAAGPEQQDVSRHDFRDGDELHFAIAQHLRARHDPLAQRGGFRMRGVFALVADESARHEDGEHDQRIGQVSGGSGDDRGKEQQQEQRTRELPPQDVPARRPMFGAQLVAPEAPEMLGRLRRRQPTFTAAELLEDLLRRERPVRSDRPRLALAPRTEESPR